MQRNTFHTKHVDADDQKEEDGDEDAVAQTSVPVVDYDGCSGELQR